MAARNEAEDIFEGYLRSRGLTWTYEEAAGNSHPDYWLDGPSEAVCEVRHVTASLEGPGGAFDVYKPLAKAVKRKAKQGRALEGVRPYVVVIWAPRWPTDFYAVVGALFGKIQIVMPFDPESGSADPDAARMGFGRDATLHGSQHEHISAVAVIQRFNPGLRAVQDEFAQRIASESAEEDPVRGTEIILDVFRQSSEEGWYEEGAAEARVVTFHNVYASTPLPLEVFDGPHDEQYSIDAASFTKVFEGDEVRHLPD